MKHTSNPIPVADQALPANQSFAVWIGLPKAPATFTTSNRPAVLVIADAALQSEMAAWEAASDEDFARFEKSLAPSA